MKMKKFDCVQMKHQIQQQLLEEMSELSPAEQRRWTEKEILSDPILGPFWKKAKQASAENRPVR